MFWASLSRRRIGAASQVHGANHATGGRPALVCGWQRSSTTGRLECVWNSERLATTLAREEKRTSALDRYLEGWAKGALEEIVEATAAGYRFHDPLVGTFSRWSLHEYFDILLHRCSRCGALERRDIAFALHGPMQGFSNITGMWFWREAPRIGLAAVAQIELSENGIIGESLVYEDNLASEMLRRAVP